MHKSSTASILSLYKAPRVHYTRSYNAVNVRCVFTVNSASGRRSQVILDRPSDPESPTLVRDPEIAQ